MGQALLNPALNVRPYPVRGNVYHPYATERLSQISNRPLDLLQSVSIVVSVVREKVLSQIIKQHLIKIDPWYFTLGYFTLSLF
jgi:hypothetical protein